MGCLYFGDKVETETLVELKQFVVDFNKQFALLFHVILLQNRVQERGDLVRCVLNHHRFSGRQVFFQDFLEGIVREFADLQVVFRFKGFEPFVSLVLRVNNKGIFVCLSHQNAVINRNSVGGQAFKHPVPNFDRIAQNSLQLIVFRQRNG